MLPVIETIEELPKSKLDWGVRRGTAPEAFFTVLFIGNVIMAYSWIFNFQNLQEAKEGIFRVIGEKLITFPNLLTNSDEEGFQRVINGSYAFIKVNNCLLNTFYQSQITAK